MQFSLIVATRWMYQMFTSTLVTLKRFQYQAAFYVVYASGNFYTIFHLSPTRFIILMNDCHSYIIPHAHYFHLQRIEKIYPAHLHIIEKTSVIDIWKLFFFFCWKTDFYLILIYSILRKRA